MLKFHAIPIPAIQEPCGRDRQATVFIMQHAPEEEKLLQNILQESRSS